MVAQSHQAHDVSIGRQELRGGVNEPIKVAAASVLGPQVVFAASLVVLPLHRTKKVARRDNTPADFLGLPQIALDQIEPGFRIVPVPVG